MDKKIALLSLFALSTVSLVTAAVVGSSYLESSASPFIFRSGAHICNGNHYLERSATEALPGCKEYWVCCNCHSHYVSSEDLPEGSVWSDKGIATEIVGDYDDRYIAYTPSPTPGGDGDFMLDYLIRLCDYALECNEPGYTTKQINSVYFSDETEDLYVAALTNEDNLIVPISTWYGYAEGAVTGEEFLDVISLDTSYSLIEEFDFSMGAPSLIDEYDLRDNDDFKTVYPGYSFKGSTLTSSASSYLFTGTGISNDEYTSVFMSSYNSSTGSYTNDYDYTESDTTTKAYLLLESIYNAMEDTPSPEPTSTASYQNILNAIDDSALLNDVPTELMGIFFNDSNEIICAAAYITEDYQGRGSYKEVDFVGIQVSNNFTFEEVINAFRYCDTQEAINEYLNDENAIDICTMYDSTTIPTDPDSTRILESEEFVQQYGSYDFGTSVCVGGSVDPEQGNSDYLVGTGENNSEYISIAYFYDPASDYEYKVDTEEWIVSKTGTNTATEELMEAIINAPRENPEPETRLSSLKKSLKTLANTGLNEKFPNYTFNELETISYYYAPPTYDDEGNIEWDAYEYFNIYFTTIEGEDTLFLCSVESLDPCGDIDTMLDTLIDNPENFEISWTDRLKENVDHKMSETALFSELFTGEVKGRDVISFEDYSFDQTIVDGKYVIDSYQAYYQYVGLMYDESLDTYKFIDTMEYAEDYYDESTCASTGDSSSLSYELADYLFNVEHHYHTHNVVHYLSRNATSIRGGCIDHYACDECNKWWINEASLPSSVEPYTEEVCNLDFEEDDVRYVDYNNPKTEIDWIIEKLKGYLANDDITPIDITNLTYIPIEDKGLCIYATYPCYEKMCGVEKQLNVYGVNDIDTFLEALLTDPYKPSYSSYSSPDNTCNWKLDASNKTELKNAFPGQHVGYTFRLNDDYYSYGGVNYNEGAYTSIYRYRTKEFVDEQYGITNIISSSTNDPSSVYYMLLDELFHDGVNDDPVTDSYVHYSYLASTSTQSGNLEYWQFADSDRFTFTRPENATIVEGTSTLGMITDSTDPRYIKPNEEPNLKQLFYANGIGLGGNNFTLVDTSDSSSTYFANDQSYREDGDTITVMTLNRLEEEGIIKQYSGEVGEELTLNKTYNVPGATTLDLHTYLRLITSTEESPLSYFSRFVQSNVTINDHVYSMHQLSPVKLDKEIFASTHDLIEDTHPTNSSNECNFSIYDIEVRFDENYKIEGFSFISPKLEYVSNPSSSNYGKVTYNYNDAYKITFSFDLENVRTTVISL